MGLCSSLRKRSKAAREQKRQLIVAYDKRIESLRRQIAGLPAGAAEREQRQLSLQELGRKRNRLAHEISVPKLKSDQFIT